jgi:signal transduction protein with GAF and PtsI domain
MNAARIIAVIAVKVRRQSHRSHCAEYVMKVLAFALTVALGASAIGAEKDEHGHDHHGMPDSEIAVPADAVGIWKAIADQQKTLADQIAAQQFETTDKTIGALAKLIKALPEKAAAGKQKIANAQTKAAVNVLEDIHHLADDKAKAKAEAKLPLLDFALKALQASVPPT